MNLNFDINIGGRLEFLDSSVLYVDEMILELCVRKHQFPGEGALASQLGTDA